MKDYIFILPFFIICSFFAQEKKSTEKITLSFKNLNRIEILKRIESISNYYFYFNESWFQKDKLLSKTYNKEQIKNVLEDILNETTINYYIYSDKKIILTNNLIIRDKFKGLESKENSRFNDVDNENIPVIVNESKLVDKINTEIVRIGKANKNSNKTNYTLKGYVKDNFTNQPISDIYIIVNNKTNTITNEAGYYSIKLPLGVNYLEAKSVGFQTFKKKIILYNDGVFNLKMSSSTELLDEIVIETNKDDNVKKAITGISKIKIEQIKSIPLILGERDILRVATAIPGIKTAGEASGGLNVRGGDADQNLILLDEAVLYNPSHFYGIFSAINPFTTASVDVYKGGIPAEYGGRLSSVFNIKTKEANYTSFKGELSIGPVTSNLVTEIPIINNKSSLLLGGRATYSNWILRSLKEPSLNKSTASFYDYNLKYSHKINKKNKFEVSMYYSNDSFSISSDSIQSYNNRLVSLKWKHRFNDKNYGDLNINNTQYRFNIEFDNNSDNDFDFSYKINETEMKISMMHLAKKHKINYGLSTKLFDVSPGEIKPRGSFSLTSPLKIRNEKALESGVFISDNFTITQKLLLNIGARYSFYAALGPSIQNIYDSNFPMDETTVIETRSYKNNEVFQTYGGPELRASFRYSLTPSLSVKGSFNNTYQFIHMLSNNTTATPTDTWRLSNKNIKPQQASQYSLGIYKNLEGNTYETSLEGYYKNSKNILDFKIGADLLLNQQIENEIIQGTGKAYGIEFLIKKNKGRLNGWIGYSYSRSFLKSNSVFEEETVNNGNYYPTNFDKPHDLNVILNWKLTKRYSFSSNFVYQTGRPITYPIGSYIYNGAERVLFSDRNKFRIPDFYRLDIGVNVEGNHKLNKIAHSFWNFSIYNVLGRNNPFSVFFVTQDGKVKAYKNSIFAIPVPTITYNIKF